MSVNLTARPEVAVAERGGSGGSRLAPWVAPAAIGMLALTGTVAFTAPLRHVHLTRMNAFGLISVLPRASLAGVALLVIAFVLALSLRRARPLLLGGILVIVVLCLHGVTSVIEAEPRFATSYQIAGFTDYVSRTGQADTGLGAYFSWPGFFALVAFVQAVGGQHSLLGVQQYWPAIINLAYLVPVWLILRTLRASWRAKWLAALLFTAGLWVGQDYFSPQSLDYLLYLLFIAFVLTWFRAGPSSGPRPEPRSAAGRVARAAVTRLVGRLEPGELPPQPTTRVQRAVLLTVLLVIFAAITVSHQLTPILLLAAMAGLVLARRCTLSGLPLLLGVIVICWLSFAATGYWSGHLSDIFGGLGHLGGNVSAGVGGRLRGASRGHELVLYLRVAFAVAVLGLAGAGLVRRRRWGLDDRAALILTLAPFISLGLQSYGGEILLRVYLFALPAASALAAFLFFPSADPGPQAAPSAGRDAAAGRAGALPPGSESARAGRAVHPAPPARRSWPALIAAAVLTVGMSSGFLVARYGNEAFEQTPRGVLAATDYLYAHDRGGIRVLWLAQLPPVDVTPEMPWQYRDIEKIQYQSSKAPADPAAVGIVIDALRAAGPRSYVITTSTQEAYLRQVSSYRPDWGPEFRRHMSAARGVHTVFANQDAAIYALHWRRGTPAAPLRLMQAGSGPISTIWTPVGLAVMGLLLLLLLAREFIRVSATTAARLIRPLTMVSLPLVAVLLTAIVERFIVLS